MLIVFVLGLIISSHKSGTFSGCRISVQDFRNIAEEVVVQQFGDAHQHGEVDALPFEHLVNNTVVAVDGFREPPHRAPLRPQLSTYHPANMYFLLIYGHKKIVNFGLFASEVLQYLYHK